MHCGSNTNDKSKTEILWIPAPSFYSASANEANRLTQTDSQNTNATISNATNTDNTNPSLDTTDIFDDPITFVGTITTQRERHKRALTFSTMTPKQREELYWRSPTTNRINLNDDGEFIEFTAHFKYLGSYISFDLTDDMDIKNRITKANQAMGALQQFWRNPYADQSKETRLPRYPSKLTTLGMRNMGPTSIPHRQTKRLLAPSHPQHPRHQNVRSNRRSHHQRANKEDLP